jgi:hypothetical protein
MIKSFMPGMAESGLPPIGLSYLKRTLIDGRLEANEKNKRRRFVQAFGWDNIEFFRKLLAEDGVLCERCQTECADDRCEECMLIQEATFYSWGPKERKEYFLYRTDYGRVLNALSDRGLRDAWIDGKWDTFEGQYFSQFDPKRHVITLDELRERIQPWHKMWASGDWGFEHPHAVYRHIQDETGCVITYGEICGRHVNEVDLAKSISQKYGKLVNGELAADGRLQSFPFSWDAGKQSKRSNPKFPRSINQMISDALPGWMPKPFPAEASPGSRIAGARLLGQLLDSGMWQIAEDCPRLIECLPSLIRDPDNPEDVLKVDFSDNKIGDDPYDAVRMGIQFMLGKANIPTHVAAAAKVAEFAKSRGKEVEDLDINTAAQLHRRALIQEQQKRNRRRGGLGRIWRPQIN